MNYIFGSLGSHFYSPKLCSTTSLSRPTTPLVKVTYAEEEFEVEADTIKGLKEEMSIKLSKGLGEYRIEVGENWRLYQFGFVLPTAGSLKDFQDDDGKIHLNLVEPQWLPRGQRRTIKNQTDKTRFIVRGSRDDFEILEIEPMKKITPTLKSKFFANQKFGIVTSIKGDEPGKRSVQFDVYEVSRNGYVVLLKSPYDESDVSVCLVPENSSEPTTDSVQLESTNTKTYLEAHMITPLQRKELLFRYMKAVFQAGATVAAGAAEGAVGIAF